MQELRKRQRSGEQAHQLQRIDSVRSQEEELSKEEVIRRLRLLGQPVTLFGEVSVDGTTSHATMGLRWSACLHHAQHSSFQQSCGLHKQCSPLWSNLPIPERGLWHADR